MKTFLSNSFLMRKHWIHANSIGHEAGYLKNNISSFYLGSKDITHRFWKRHIKISWEIYMSTSIFFSEKFVEYPCCCWFSIGSSNRGDSKSLWKEIICKIELRNHFYTQFGITVYLMSNGNSWRRNNIFIAWIINFLTICRHCIREWEKITQLCNPISNTSLSVYKNHCKEKQKNTPFGRIVWKIKRKTKAIFDSLFHLFVLKVLLAYVEVPYFHSSKIRYPGFAE